jgi:hypothetical protein
MGIKQDGRILQDGQEMGEGGVLCALCFVLGAWCLVLGAWCLVLGAWCLVLGAWCLVLGAWCFVGNVKIERFEE